MSADTIERWLFLVLALLLAVFVAAFLFGPGPKKETQEERIERQSHYRVTHTVNLIAPLAPGACQYQDLPEPVGAIRVCMPLPKENGR